MSRVIYIDIFGICRELTVADAFSQLELDRDLYDRTSVTARDQLCEPLIVEAQ